MTAKLGITYSVNKKIRLYTSYNSGFDPFEPSSVIQIFNQPFKQVTSVMFEAGAKVSLLKKGYWVASHFTKSISITWR